MLNNEDRAERAFNQVTRYSGDNDIETDVQDILVDLRHLCDREGIDFHRKLDMSYTHYSEELAEDGGPAGEKLERMRSTTAEQMREAFRCAFVPTCPHCGSTDVAVPMGHAKWDRTTGQFYSDVSSDKDSICDTCQETGFYAEMRIVI